MESALDPAYADTANFNQLCLFNKLKMRNKLSRVGVGGRLDYVKLNLTKPFSWAEAGAWLSLAI